MPAWNAAAVLANSENLTGGEAVSEIVSQYRAPVVCVALESLDGSSEDTVTVEFEGSSGTYKADERTLAEPGSFTVEVPQCETVSVTSSNGCTYSIEVRANPS